MSTKPQLQEANDAAWEDGRLGQSLEHARRAPESVAREVGNALDLQLVSIRLPRKLIDDLKLIARNEGLGYQPLVRRVLMRFANAEIRAMAHDEWRSMARQGER